MVNWSGFCMYPHGGFTTAGLIVAVAAALTATTYAAGSCRFVLLTYTSDSGNLEEYYNSEVTTVVSGGATDSSNTQFIFQTGVGLFQWLKPTSGLASGDWSNGACVGYTTTILEGISDTMFEAARGVAVFSVLLAFGSLIWTLSTACLGFNWIQLLLIAFCLFAGGLCAGLTFLIKLSYICQDAFLARKCALDEGGLVMCAAVIFWFVAFLISVYFMKPAVGPDPLARARSGGAQNRVASDTKNKSKNSKQRSSSKSSDRRSRSNSTTPRTTSLDDDDNKNKRRTSLSSCTARNSATAGAAAISSSQRPKPTRLTVDDVTNDEEMEVYISNRLDKIQSMI